jgi:hypothetical protein
MYMAAATVMKMMIARKVTMRNIRIFLNPQQMRMHFNKCLVWCGSNNQYKIQGLR